MKKNPFFAYSHFLKPQKKNTDSDENIMKVRKLC